MLFSLPENTISGIVGYAFDFFDTMKIYIFLILGVGLAFIILNYIRGLFFAGSNWYTGGGFRDDPSLTEEDIDYYESETDE